jgi:hypothetical protein
MLLQGSLEREALGKPQQFRFRPHSAQLFPELLAYSSSIRPNGKPTLELSTGALPAIATAPKCRIACIVFLDRQAGAAAVARPVESRKAVEQLIGELPDFGERVTRRHQQTLWNLRGVPAYKLGYSEFAGAIETLGRLV